jgi:hypothetical protein
MLLNEGCGGGALFAGDGEIAAAECDAGAE